MEIDRREAGNGWGGWDIHATRGARQGPRGNATLSIQLTNCRKPFAFEEGVEVATKPPIRQGSRDSVDIFDIAPALPPPIFVWKYSVKGSANVKTFNVFVDAQRSTIIFVAGTADGLLCLIETTASRVSTC